MNRVEWHLSILRGLWVAANSDMIVFLLALSGLLLGGRKGLGKALLLYTVFSRADGYARLFDAKMTWIAQAISEGHE